MASSGGALRNIICVTSLTVTTTLATPPSFLPEYPPEPPAAPASPLVSAPVQAVHAADKAAAAAAPDTGHTEGRVPDRSRRTGYRIPTPDREGPPGDGQDHIQFPLVLHQTLLGCSGIRFPRSQPRSSSTLVMGLQAAGCGGPSAAHGAARRIIPDGLRPPIPAMTTVSVSSASDA